MVTQLQGILKNTVLEWTSIEVHEIVDSDYRLDANIYGIEGRRARQDVAQCKWDVVYLGEKFIENAFYLGRFKRIYVEEKDGVPFILPSQITEVYPKVDKFISPATKVNIEDTRVERGQVLLTRSGTIGVVSYVSETLKNQSLSDDVIRIKATEYPGYIYTYLKSRVGRLLVETNNYGAVIKHIEPEHLNAIPIPNPPPILKQEIHNLIEESFNLRDESNELLDTAQILLKEALELPSIEVLYEQAEQFDKTAGVLNYSVPLSKVIDRLDGSYYVPVVKVIEQHLVKTAKEVVKVGDARISQSVILPSHFKRIYVNEGEGTVLIGGKHIDSLDPADKKYLAAKQYQAKLKNDMLLAENMIIVSAKGTPGKVVTVPSHWQGWFISSNLIKIVPISKEIAGFLYCFLASPYGETLIKRQIYGAVVDIIEPIHVESIIVPFLRDEKIQREINDTVLEANRKRTEAYNLEQEALRVLDEKVIYAR